MDIGEFAETGLKVGAKLKLDDMELLCTSTSMLMARIENREVTLRLEENLFCAGVRFIKSGRMGYVPLAEPSAALLETGIRAALAKAGPAPFPDFTLIERQRDDLEARDQKVAALLSQPAKVRDFAQDIVSRSWATGRVETLEGHVAIQVEDRLLTTLHSRVPVRMERTLFSTSTEVDSKDFDIITGRNLPDLEAAADLGARLALDIPKTSSTPEAEGVKGRSVPVTIHPVMMDEILRRLVAEHFYASTVQEGMSKYRLGDRVGSELVTLWDDATNPFGFHTFPTDDEGSPSQRTLVIENGILRTFLYDRASAAREGRPSTGSGRRRPVLIEEEHEAPIRCTCADLVLKPGTTPLREMIAGIGSGVLAKYLLGFHTSNRTTGDFANTLYMGRVIRNGELAALPEPGRWSIKGNALELMRNITAVSRETMKVGASDLPWVRTELAVA
ncbi:MAG: TldD/PmbA family protein [candidate division WOR-3 bacterium]